MLGLCGAPIDQMPTAGPERPPLPEGRYADEGPADTPKADRFWPTRTAFFDDTV